MANFWDTLKNALGNAGTAAQNINQQAISTAHNKSSATTTQSVNQPVNTLTKQPTAQDRLMAQAYAQAALSGTSGIYVPASQTANAVINAQLPITTVTQEKSTKPDTARADAVYSAYAQAQAQQHQLYKQQEELAAKQRDGQQQALDQQNEAMKKQRQAVLNATVDANNQAAEGSLRQAYIAYMLSQKNLLQQLKSLGISGGATETTLADVNNNYMNNRFGIEEGRNSANASARRDYDTATNSDYMDYLSALAKINSDYNNRLYSLSQDNASTLSSLAKSSQSAAKKGADKAQDSVQTVTGLRIGDEGTVYTSGEQLLHALENMGFTREQALAYAAAQGIKV